jgi:hypothetical protein
MATLRSESMQDNNCLNRPVYSHSQKTKYFAITQCSPSMMPLTEPEDNTPEPLLSIYDDNYLS